METPTLKQRKTGRKKSTRRKHDAKRYSQCQSTKYKKVTSPLVMLLAEYRRAQQNAQRTIEALDKLIWNVDFELDLENWNNIRLLDNNHKTVVATAQMTIRIDYVLNGAHFTKGERQRINVRRVLAINHIAVNPAWQGRMLASLLITYLLASVVKNNPDISHAVLWDMSQKSHQLENLYASVGFDTIPLAELNFTESEDQARIAILQTLKHNRKTGVVTATVGSGGNHKQLTLRPWALNTLPSLVPNLIQIYLQRKTALTTS